MEKDLTFFNEFRAKVIEKGYPTLRDETLKTLLETIKKTKPQKILEIGTSIGCSGIGMLLAAENARLFTIEIDEEDYLLAKENFKDFSLSDQVEQFLGDAEEILNFLSGEFDFILLDGPKGKYLTYYQSVKRLLKKGGVLFCDNISLKYYDLKKKPHRSKTARKNMGDFLETINSDGDFTVKIFDTEDGFLIAEKK